MIAGINQSINGRDENCVLVGEHCLFFLLLDKGVHIVQCQRGNATTSRSNHEHVHEKVFNRSLETAH